MNATMDNSHNNDLRYAEYVLGVLDADARLAVEQEMHQDVHAAASVALWQKHLLPLSEDIAGIEPAPYVWARILDALGLVHAVRQTSSTIQASSATQQGGWWNSLNLWRWVGVGASIATAASLVLLFQAEHPTTLPAVTAPAAGYMVANIAQDNGVAGWTATMDLQRGRMVVVPATPEAMASGKAPELWLIPPGEKPMSLGVIATNKPTTVTLRPDLLARLSAKALLAVSVEPPGGSPTGQPTGAVIAKGAISGA